MKLKLEEKLFNNYPKLFRQKDFGMQETCMCCEISTGDGWYDLINILCSKIQDYIEANGLRQTKAVQVKGKFGSLRFYVDFSDDHIEDLISDAERESRKICEYCGSKDEVGQTRGWIVTICKSCAEKNNIKEWRNTNED